MTDNELKEKMYGIWYDYYIEVISADVRDEKINTLLEKHAKSYHLARLEIPEKEIDEMATQYDNGGLNQSQWVGFTWGAKAVIEKLRQ